MRIIDFAPGLSFNRLIQSILKLEHGLVAGSAWSGTDTDDPQGPNPFAQTPAGAQALANVLAWLPCTVCLALCAVI